jgi:hypothetical protein
MRRFSRSQRKNKNKHDNTKAMGNNMQEKITNEKINVS